MKSVNDIIEELKSTGRYTEIVCEILRDMVKDLKRICRIQNICIAILMLSNIILLFSKIL